MKSYIRIMLLSIVVLAACSCSKNDTNALAVIDFDDAKETAVDSIIQKIEIIPLEITEDLYPNGISNLYVTNDNIILKDNINEIFVFDMDGHIRSNSKNKMGHGAGEYSVVTAFTYNPHSNNMEIVTPKDMLFFDLDFNLTKKCDIPTKMPDKSGNGAMFFDNVYDLSENDHLFIPQANCEENRQIIRFNSDTGEITASMNYENDIISNTTMQTDICFENGRGELMFYPPAISKYLFSINLDDNSLDRLYSISTGKNGFSEEDVHQFGDNKDALDNFALTCDKNIPLKVMGAGDAIIIVYKNGASLKNVHTIFYDVKTANSYKIDSYKNDVNIFPLIQYVDKNGIYAVVDSDKLMSLKSSLSLDKIYYKSDSIPDGSYVLLKYSFK